ncbi:FKBP-type peptidyl-prolyl cis-trans isomerase [Cytophaga aurantiaca]|uniref:FKBP-type peptidyl-prolyl cis-trans isomerase n=1 Tax=Cytophaga aurantiaca TaxID=29530 RepID=UPI0003643DC1|nr:FKBP-type peptidyl-prolyl cis-trans isomerase [Cytophaga aurantiaca]
MKSLLSIIVFTAVLLLISTSSHAAHDTLVTASGIKYIQIQEGVGERPTSNQKVKIVYSVKSSNGDVIESNELSKPLEFRLDKHQVIPGIEDIVKYMNRGEELFCIIPAYLAHGDKGKGAIDPHTTLYVYIQIIDIE